MEHQGTADFGTRPFGPAAWNLRHRLGTVVAGPASEEAGRALLEKLAEVEGPVLIPYHSHYAIMSGHEMNFHLVALRDNLRGGSRFKGREALNQIIGLIEKKHFKVIVWDSIGPRIPELEAAINTHYSRQVLLFSEGDLRFYTLSGIKNRPDRWLTPTDPAGGPP